MAPRSGKRSDPPGIRPEGRTAVPQVTPSNSSLEDISENRRNRRCSGPEGCGQPISPASAELFKPLFLQPTGAELKGLFPAIPYPSDDLFVRRRGCPPKVSLRTSEEEVPFLPQSATGKPCQALAQRARHPEKYPDSSRPNRKPPK